MLIRIRITEICSEEEAVIKNAERSNSFANLIHRVVGDYPCGEHQVHVAPA